MPLAGLTTLEVGGPARYFADVVDVEQLQCMLEVARKADLPLVMVGQGSNLLVSDEGFAGLALRYTGSEVELLERGEGHVRVKVAAGMVWDRWVAHTVSEGWAGIECLSGIPGLVGAAPIQNIGAYGQEIAEVLQAVWTVDRRSGAVERFEHSACGFGYRQSHFKSAWRDRFVVTHVEMTLRQGGLGTVRYADLQKRLAMTVDSAPPQLAELRDHVLEIRRAKSMVWDRSDPNHRSAGSFFMNPVLDVAQADVVQQRARELSDSPGSMPCYPAGDRQVKLSAAWLIERAGFARGYTSGPVGLSSNHVLALINRGGARARDVLDLAALIRAQVEEKFGVVITPEPDLVGFDKPIEELLRL